MLDPRRWYALAALCVAAFMVVLDVSIVNVALPTIGEELGFSQEGLQWVITAYAIVFGGFLLLGGRLADLLGRRLFFMVGIGLFTAASLLCGLAWSDASLIVFRALQGLGGALLSPAALSILTTTFPEGRERNRALGVWGAVAGSGAAAGTLLGGVLTSGLGWEWIFFVNVPVGVAVVALSPLLLRESHAEASHRHFDFLGAASITAALMLLVYAMTRATEAGWSDPTTVVLLFASALLHAFFFAVELRSRAPLVPFRIFRLKTLRASNLVGFLIGAAVFSQFFILSLYMQQVLGYSALKTGVAYVASTLTIIVFAGVAQSLVTRFGVRRVLSVGMLFSTAALLYYTRLPVSGNYWVDLMPAFIVGGVGLAFGFIPVSIGALTGVKAHEAGVASGIINTSQQIGGAIGLAVASTVAATWTNRWLADNPGVEFSPVALVDGFHAAFYLLAGLTVLASLLAALLVEPHVKTAHVEGAEGGDVEADRTDRADRTDETAKTGEPLEAPEAVAAPSGP